MLNFQAYRDGKTTYPELVAGLTRDDLRRLTDEMLDTTLALIAGCTDADVTFTPVDPQAGDPYAATPEEAHMPWTLGHVVVHNTPPLRSPPRSPRSYRCSDNLLDSRR
jgi:hypothetical protein